jgi:drug/metabolite transporter (DMT)-like permease
VPHLAFLLCGLVWGGSFILMDRAAHAFGPIAIGMGRMIGGAAAIAIYCLVKRQWAPITWRDLPHLTIAALLANVYPYVIQPYVMLKAGEHGFTGMMVAFVPLLTIAVSIPMLGVWPTSRQLVGVAGGLVCTALIVWDGTQRGLSPGVLALALSTPLSYALGNTYIKWKLVHLPAAPLTVAYLAIGAATLLPFVLAPELLDRLQLGGPANPHDYPLAITALVTLGVVGTGICVLIFVHLIQTQGPLFAGMVTYVIPVVALMWGQFDREPLTGAQVAAIAGVLTMVAFVQWRATTPAEIVELTPTSEPPV